MGLAMCCTGERKEPGEKIKTYSKNSSSCQIFGSGDNYHPESSYRPDYMYRRKRYENSAESSDLEKTDKKGKFFNNFS